MDAFVRRHYRQRYSRYATPLPPPSVTVAPANCPSRLIGLRLRLRLTQGQLARRIGAANKPVIDQWEACKRTPSIAFWVRVEQLVRASSRSVTARATSNIPDG